MKLIKTILADTATRVVLGLLLVAFVALKGWLALHDAGIAARANAKIDTSAKELAREAVAARRPAALPGAADRLRTRDNCRDC